VERALLVRHAESTASLAGTVNGVPAAGIALSELGRTQATELAGVLAREPIGVVAVTDFPRTVETADLALPGRELPRIVVPELNDPDYGDFEGGVLETFRDWAASHPATERPPGGSESRAEIADRYARGFRRLLERTEPVVVAFLHSLPIAYVLSVLEGREPQAKERLIEYATVFEVRGPALARAAERLEAWAGAPTW
jgi:broad specificity phosphatase PhoE